MKKVKLRVKDNKGVESEKEALEIGVVDNIDKWSSVTLEDGTIIRHQHPVVKVFKIIGEFDPEGNPLYMMNHASISSVTGVVSNEDEK